MVVAVDGYSIPFQLDNVMDDTQFLLSNADDGLWLIAAQYDGSQWVRQVTTLQVY